MKSDDRILRNPLVALAPAEDGYLAYDIETSRLHRLNTAATLIIELSDGTRTAADVCLQLAPLLDSTPEGCTPWIEAARSGGLLKSVTAGVPLPAAPSPREFASLARRLRGDGQVLAAFVCQHYATYLLSDDPDQWHALGELAHILGRREDAREAYERYAQFKPEDAEVAQILISLRDEPPPPRAPDRCVEQLYSRFAEFYEDNMCGDLDYQAPARLAEALDAELVTAKNLHVLELGCGTGLAAQHLRKHARRLSGIDLSPQMVARARATGLYDYLEVAEITEWLSRSDIPAFNLIAACDTLIYFGDLRQVVIPAATRILKGGWLAFTVERGETIPFRLTDSGRYAHAEAHVRAVAGEAGLTVASLAEGFLRYEYGQPVVGLVTILRKQ
jgi:predicted TPR repeat methyltransferase